VVAATGFEPGGVAPFPHVSVRRVLVEHTLLSSQVVWVGAGSPSHMAALTPVELVRLTRGEAADIVQESA
jgi:prolyl-tRNA editing enzyme YbaK/EbsC (Cys-tRNA(Pro) deacylase)